jgi:RND family efflux transporter MFP subunit
MGQPKKLVLPAAVLICGLAVAYGLLVGKPKPAPNAPVPERAPIVQVVLAEPQDVTLSVTSQGTVRPRREINIVSQVAGRVQHVAEHFAEGGFFDANTELVKVEDDDYQFDLVRAQARVADAQQLVAIEKGRVRQAAREWRDLGNEDANQLFLRKPQLASTEATLRAAEADLGQARLNLERTSLKVPFNGRISKKHVDLGQYISQGTPVARVYATDVVEIRLPLTDRQVGLLNLPLNFADRTVQPETGAGVILSARFADREWQWQGRVVRTDPSIDVDSRVVYAVVEVERPFVQEANSERPPLGIGLFVHPRDQTELLEQSIREMGVESHVQIFRSARHGADDNPAFIRSLWDLNDLRERYRAFSTRFGKLSENRELMTGEKAFALRFHVVIEFLRVAWEDPDLPPDLLPGDWHGDQARLLARSLYRQCLPHAREYAASFLRNSTPMGK